MSITVLLAGKSSMTFPRCFLFAGILLTASTASARAIDEIQVYNAEIAKVGQWTFQLNMEIRPIVGWRKGDYEFIINPIVDLGFGQNGGADFAPCARLARNFGEDLADRTGVLH
jgi:hypothetical protein